MILVLVSRWRVGNRTLKMLPTPTWLDTETVPRWVSMMRFDTARPRPVPRSP